VRALAPQGFSRSKQYLVQLQSSLFQGREEGCSVGGPDQSSSDSQLCSLAAQTTLHGSGVPASSQTASAALPSRRPLSASQRHAAHAWAPRSTRGAKAICSEGVSPARSADRAMAHTLCQRPLGSARGLGQCCLAPTSGVERFRRPSALQARDSALKTSASLLKQLDARGSRPPAVPRYILARALSHECAPSTRSTREKHSSTSRGASLHRSRAGECGTARGPSRYMLAFLVSRRRESVIWPISRTLRVRSFCKRDVWTQRSGVISATRGVTSSRPASSGSGLRPIRRRWHVLSL